MERSKGTSGELLLLMMLRAYARFFGGLDGFRSFQLLQGFCVDLDTATLETSRQPGDGSASLVSSYWHRRNCI